VINNDSLISAIKTLLADNITCEDNKIFISNKFKYDVFNLLIDTNEEFKNQLYNKLEYEECDK